jgi:hypothetical protein
MDDIEIFSTVGAQSQLVTAVFIVLLKIAGLLNSTGSLYATTGPYRPVNTCRDTTQVLKKTFCHQTSK